MDDQTYKRYKPMDKCKIWSSRLLRNTAAILMPSDLQNAYIVAVTIALMLRKA